MPTFFRWPPSCDSRLTARAFVGFLFEHRDWLRIHLRTRIASSVRPSDEATADLWERGLREFEIHLAEGMRQGCFHEADATELAVLVNSLLKIQVTYAVDCGEEDGDRVAERLLVYLRRLLGAPVADASDAA